MKTYIFSTLCVSSIFLSGCVFGSQAEEEIGGILETAVTEEEGYVQAQNELRELEAAEQELYNEIMALSMEEFETVSELADEALANLDEREEQLNAEAEAVNQSSEVFQEVEPLISDLETEELQSHVESMVETMNERYTIHEDLSAAYAESLGLNRELYNMLKEEDLELEELENQITLVNEQNSIIIELNDDFNEATTEYNELKSAFYEMAEIETEE
ncbi:YkyA family protein [Jeotgalibacillus sp. R-1-5s-1]|uniref:YkyA family protein n=1 Tax=Jeotgalibacillus sp. R-1-5s-1 TaxID=2555897 RepID=UPI00141B6651|nr:YkyA family protein [Jeotgalibacillus sp. R-1-5s-1]